MATINTAIKLNDQMSSPLRKIIDGMNMMLSSWETLESATSRGLSVGNVEAVRSKLHQAAQEIDRMGEEQEDFNRKVQEGASATDGLLSGLRNAAVALGLAKVATDAIDYASDLQEVQNVVDVSFGNSSAVVDEWSKTTLNAFGLSELSAKQFAGTMGAMLNSSGLTGDAVSEMSMKIAELAGDMASFYNLQGEEAFAKIRSGISGETEPLKQLGINMSVANLEAFALSQGIKTAYSEMSQAEQVTLRYNYLLQATANAQGDFARTSDSFANQQKLLMENWRAFAGEIATNVLPILTMLLGALNSTISFMSENWSILAPIILGAAAALGLYWAVTKGVTVAQTVLSTVMGAFKAIQTFVSIGWGVITGNTAAASAAQFVYNSALLACPLTWILLIIIAVIAALFAIVAAINKVTNSTISATGLIAGILASAGAFIWNLFIGLLNAIIQAVWSIFVEPFIGVIEWVLNAANGGFNSFGDMVANLIGQIIGWFLSLGTVVTKIIDAIFGTNWTDGLNSLRDSVVSWGKNEDAITLDRSAPQIGSRISYSSAFGAGYDWGADVGGSISNTFGGGLGNQYSMDKLAESIGDVPTIGDIANYTGDTADALDTTNENLKYLRDIAEQEAVNRFTTAEVRVEMTNHNSISSNMDLDGAIDYWVTGVQEALERTAEGVHA